MPTEIYKTRYVKTFEGEEVEITPLKIKYLKQLMNAFSTIDYAEDEDQKINVMVECVRIAMKQYRPDLSKDVSLIEDNFDLHSIYKILDYAAKIKILGNSEDDEEPEPQQEDGDPTTWENLDLAKLESEVFVLGIWKNFEDLETALSLEELMKILETIRDLDYQEKKFSAALKGIDLDEQTGKNDAEVKGQQEWENLKARVYSRGATTDANDILSMQGQNAASAGFGIGFGLDYEDARDPAVML